MMTTHRTYKLGKSRDQASFLPPSLEDYVGRDNPVRAIDAYVDSLDLNDLSFWDVGSDGGAGQPPYDPADLLKLYLYGYLHQVRSSRRLERETRRNVELMWLLGGLTPGYRTIANFRKDNAAGLKAANRDFVRLARRLDLLGGTLVAIDGAFFDGDASKASIATEKRHKRLAENKGGARCYLFLPELGGAHRRMERDLLVPHDGARFVRAAGLPIPRFAVDHLCLALPHRQKTVPADTACEHLPRALRASDAAMLLVPHRVVMAIDEHPKLLAEQARRRASPPSP